MRLHMPASTSISISKIAMQRGFQKIFWSYNERNHLAGCRRRECFYYVGCKTTFNCFMCLFLSILQEFFWLWEAGRMHAMNRFKLVFLLSKFMVLFISNVSFVWFTFQCGFVFFSSAMGTSGDWSWKEEGWNIHMGIGTQFHACSFPIFISFFFPTFILFFPFSLFSCKLKFSN